MRTTALILVGVALLAMSGCASRPTDFLIPQAVATPNTDRVEVLVATTRSSQGAAPGQLFTSARGAQLGFADIVVSIPPGKAHKLGEVEWPSPAPGDPARQFVTLRADVLGKEEALARFHAEIRRAPHRQVLVFVHGYNTHFEEAVYRFAQIVQDSEAKVTPVLFTWPSRGQTLSYLYDRDSANYSRDALERVLRALAADRSVGEISVLAHSMGGWLTMEALRQMAIGDGRVNPKIRRVILAAPDISVDIFRQQMARLGEHKPSFTVFVAKDDKALGVSGKVWGEGVRLGSADAHAEPFASQMKAAGVDVFDLTDVKSSDSLGHGRFAEAPEVVQLIGRRLAGGQELAEVDKSPGRSLGLLTNSAATMFNSAADLIVQAPAALVGQ